MTVLLLDTQAWAWTMIDADRIPARSRAAISEAAEVLVSPVSVYEIAQKVRIGKWDAMAPYMRDPEDLVDRQGFAFAPVPADLMLRAAEAPWDHLDPFDRIIAATAEALGAVLVSADTAFDGSPFRVRRLW